MIKGIDISHHNSPIPWDNLSKEVRFVFCKATQGASYRDPQFNQNWQYLKKTDKARGGYHFLTAVDSAQAQADNFLSFGVDFSKPNVLPPVLDIEDQVPASLNSGITKDKDAFIRLIDDWLVIVEKATGRKPIIYSYKNFFRDYLKDHSWPHYGLWLASYQSTPPGLPKGYKKADFWQYSQFGTFSGNIKGGGLDLDYFMGSEDEFKAISNSI